MADPTVASITQSFSRMDVPLWRKSPKRLCQARTLRIIALAAFGFSAPRGAYCADPQLPAESASSPTLHELLAAYFRVDDPKERSQAVSKIVLTTDGNIERTAEELRKVQLWTDQPDKGTWTIKLPSGDQIEVLVRLPQRYNPGQAMPVILAMPPQGQSTHDALDAAIDAIGAPGRDHAWVMPAEPVSGAFHQPIAAALNLPALLREIRRHIHVDCERTYLLGFSDGASAAWNVAIMYPSEFAGVIVTNGYPRIPYPQQAYALLLPNLGELPVLALWNRPGAPEHSESVAMVAINQAIADFAKHASLRITGVELAGDWTRPDQDSEVHNEISRILSSRRSATTARIRHWFRYPGQGRCGWLRATEFADDVWQDDQFSITPGPTTDRDRFITDTIAEKLALLSGHVEGQSIFIETRRCGGVELRLSPGQIDFEKPVTVVCNGRKRFDGLIRPSITDLLESAYEDWDFQHLVFARKTFLIRTDSSVDVP